MARSGYYLTKFVGNIGRLNLYEINTSDKTSATVNKLRDLGFRQEALDLERLVKRTAKEKIKEIASTALGIARDHVPIDSTELQRKHIKAEYGTDDNGLPNACIYVDSEPHYGSRRKRPETALVLAWFLQTRSLRRSQDQPEHSEGSPTKGWITATEKHIRRDFPRTIKIDV